MIPRSLRLISSLVPLWIIAACAAEAPQEAPAAGGQPPVLAAAGPLERKADGLDGADRECRIVLRELARLPSGPWTWRATIDVADYLPGAPGLLYKATTGGDGWWQADALRDTAGDTPGFARWIVEVRDHLPAEGMSGTALSRARVEAIPFLANGPQRLFDHNRLPGDFDNYTLDLGNSFSVGLAPEVCPPQAADPTPEPDPAPEEPAYEGAVVSFAPGQAPAQDGPLVGGGALTVLYDLERLPGCRSTHNGYPAWELRAFARFNNQPAPQERSVRAFESVHGVPTNTVRAVPAVFDIPQGATSVELWFLASSYASGVPCEAWDSNNSQNYRLDVLAPPGWIGEPTVKITRAGGHACDGGVPLGDGFTYDTWARTRAIAANLCFQVWQEGTTDRDNPDLWRQLDVQVHYRLTPDGPLHTAYVPFLDRVGNNARYALDLRALDPFKPYTCPEPGAVTTTPPPAPPLDVATLRLSFTVNGAELLTERGQPFAGRYEDYADNAWRDATCP